MDWMYFLDKMNLIGFLVVIYVLERVFPARPTAWLSRGWFFDLIHMYDPYIRAFFVMLLAAWLIPYAAVIPGAGLLAGSSILVNFLVLVVVSEAAFYFVHRAMHRYPWLWEFHRVHHSSSTYYSLMTSRFHVFDVVAFTLPYIVIASWLGARVEALIGMSLFHGFMDKYVHSNIRAPMFTGFVIGNPIFHSWHHSNHPEARGKNFSRDCSFMDYLFGTAYFPKDKIPLDFGDPKYPVNYFTQQALPFWNLGRKVARKFKGTRPAAPPSAIEPAAQAEPSRHP